MECRKVRGFAKCYQGFTPSHAPVHKVKDLALGGGVAEAVGVRFQLARHLAPLAAQRRPDPYVRQREHAPLRAQGSVFARLPRQRQQIWECLSIFAAATAHRQQLARAHPGIADSADVAARCSRVQACRCFRATRERQHPASIATVHTEKERWGECVQDAPCS